MTKENRGEISYWQEGLSFGLADSIICLGGMIIGIAAATGTSSIVIITGLIGGIADSFGNSIGFYLSQQTERSIQIFENRELGKDVRIHSQRENVISGIMSFVATLIVLAILLTPFLFLSVTNASILAIVTAIILSFGFGSYTARLSGENTYKCGLRYCLITVAGALLSYGIGDVLKNVFA